MRRIKNIIIEIFWSYVVLIFFAGVMLFLIYLNIPQNL
jgi:hypothetical protein